MYRKGTIMTRTALFVDIPNLYTSLLSSGIAEPRDLRDYFLYWFDFDRLALALTETYAPVWIFYSGKKFGPKPNRIEGSYLEEFITRINSMRGITAYDVNIPGEQREPARFKCEQCGKEGVAQWESEKGIDSSLTVHLFDTYEAWETAFLLSGDADFVPVVRSLRRRGKIVTGAGFKDASSALVRECYEYIDLQTSFFERDFEVYLVFRQGGLIEKWLTDIQLPANTKDDCELTFEVTINKEGVSLATIGDHANSRWDEMSQVVKRIGRVTVSNFRRRNRTGQEIWLPLTPLHFSAVRDALKETPKRVKGLSEAFVQGDSNAPERYSITYQCNPKTSTYVVKT